MKALVNVGWSHCASLRKGLPREKYSIPMLKYYAVIFFLCVLSVNAQTNSAFKFTGHKELEGIEIYFDQADTMLRISNLDWAITLRNDSTFTIHSTADTLKSVKLNFELFTTGFNKEYCTGKIRVISDSLWRKKQTLDSQHTFVVKRNLPFSTYYMRINSDITVNIVGGTVNIQLFQGDYFILLSMGNLINNRILKTENIEGTLYCHDAYVPGIPTQYHTMILFYFSGHNTKYAEFINVNELVFFKTKKGRSGVKKFNFDKNFFGRFEFNRRYY